MLKMAGRAKPSVTSEKKGKNLSPPWHHPPRKSNYETREEISYLYILYKNYTSNQFLFFLLVFFINTEETIFKKFNSF